MKTLSISLCISALAWSLSPTFAMSLAALMAGLTIAASVWFILFTA